jgi:hypothetical protein
MIHLRKFNEGHKEELEEFCELNLAYLVDKDFNIFIDDFTARLEISITMGKLIDKNLFYWNRVKDYIIPFLIRLKQSWNVFKNLEFKLENGNYSRFLVDDVIEDKLEFVRYTPNQKNIRISNIIIYVNK